MSQIYAAPPSRSTDAAEEVAPPAADLSGGVGNAARAEMVGASASEHHHGLLDRLGGWFHEAGEGIEHGAEEIRDGAMNVGGEAIGLAEMVGLKYPVKPYEAKVSGQLYRGSRVEDDAHMQALAQQGVKGIVNLCAENDMDTQRAERFGLAPLHVPIIDNTAPDVSQVREFLAFVSGNGPVYVHCEAGQGRTGTMVACYRVSAMGWSAEQAVEEAKSFGMKMPCQIAFIREFAALTVGAVAEEDVEAAPSAVGAGSDPADA